MADERTFAAPADLSLSDLETWLRHEEKLLGPLVRIAATDRTDATFDMDLEPPDKEISITLGAIVPVGRTKVCGGTARIIGQPQAVVTYR